MEETFRRKIVSCVEKSMRTEFFSKINIDFNGTNKKGAGYLADFIFVAVTGTDKDNKYKKVHLALKIGRTSKELIEHLPMVIEFYKRESFFYDTVLPAFRQFQLEKNIVNIFDAFPKCYGTVSVDDIEALVLEDLKQKGFTLHNKQLPMNLQHLQIVLKNYAKFHALSLAFRDQQKDEFDKVTANYDLLTKKGLPNFIMTESDPKLLMVLKEAGRDDLAAKYVEETRNNEFTRLLAVLDDVPEESVILHMDCHNNNFLFKYEFVIKFTIVKSRVMEETFRRKIVSCVEKSMRTEFFSKINIDFNGTNKKGAGYLADFIFVAVTGTDKDNKYKKVHLALKIGRTSKELIENLPMVIEFYKRESFFYDTVLPAFRQFQLEKNIVNIFDAFPKCYGTVLVDDIEALVLEDLKQKGYTSHNKQLTMNLQHLQIVLKNYAKFHALSLAFRDQQKDEYDKVTANYDLLTKKFLPNFIMTESDPKLLMVLKEAGRDDLAAKYVEETRNNEFTRLLAVLDDIPEESVILQMDCHNNNFLFKYEDNHEENPLSVAIIDWQLSGIHSPVLDLSYFLYSTASRKDLFQLEELLKFYHAHLTDFMKQLGSDAQNVFPYSTLVEHWRKYSIYGVVIAKIAMLMYYIPEDQAPVITGNNELDQNVRNNIKLQNEDLYRERLISIVEQYLDFRLT